MVLSQKELFDDSLNVLFQRRIELLFVFEVVQGHIFEDPFAGSFSEQVLFTHVFLDFQLLVLQSAQVKGVQLLLDELSVF